MDEVITFSKGVGSKVYEDKTPDSMTHQLWSLRVEIALGRREPPEVEFTPLDHRADELDERVYAGLITLFECRGLLDCFEKDAYAVYTARFAADWVGGIEEWQANRAIKRLEDMGVVERGKKVKLPESQWKANTWRLKTPAPARTH